MPKEIVNAIPLPPLTTWQRDVFFSPKRHKLLFGGRKKGKTHVAAMDAFRVAMQGGYVIWSAGDSDLADVGWEELTVWLRRYAERYAPSNKGIVTTESGGKIKKVSAAKATSGRGPAPDLVVVDECQTVGELFIQRARPSIIINGGRLLMMGTPPDNPAQLDNAQYIKRMIDNPQSYPDWLIDNRPTTYRDISELMRISRPECSDMSIDEVDEMAKAEMEALRSDMGANDYAREIEAQWIIKETGVVITEWRDNMVSDRYAYDPNGGRVFWFIDRGEGAAYTICLFCQVRTDAPGFNVFAEIATKEIVEEIDFVEDCIAESERHGWAMPSELIYDVRAPRFRLAAFKKKITYFAKSRSVHTGARMVNTLCRKGWIGVHPRCELMIQNFEKWKWKGKKDSMVGPADYSDDNRDAMDALRYGSERLMELYHGVWHAQAKDWNGEPPEKEKTIWTFSWI